MSHRSTTARLVVVVLAGATTLGACQPRPREPMMADAGARPPVSPNCAGFAGPPPPQGMSGLAEPVLGGLAGAGVGALLGNLIAGKHHNTGAILGGAALGGLAGSLGGYAYSGREQAEESSYRQQQLIQCDRLEQQHHENAVFNQWSGSQGRGGAAGGGDGAIDMPDQIRQAQRMLLALNYYKGPADGLLGPTTSEAVLRFQKDHGMPATGDVNQALLNRLRIAL